MARKQEPGIAYYPTNVDQVTHAKIKLLMSEFGTEGFWIYKCLEAETYKHKGYYMEVSDSDHITLFATDVCKKQVALVDEVIKGCVRRDLFSKVVFDAFAVLTSDRIQENYLEATVRRKEPRVLIAKYFLIDYNLHKNVTIIKENVTSTNENAYTSTQSKLNEIKEDEIKPADKPPDFSKNDLFKTQLLEDSGMMEAIGIQIREPVTMDLLARYHSSLRIFSGPKEDYSDYCSHLVNWHQKQKNGATKQIPEQPVKRGKRV